MRHADTARSSVSSENGSRSSTLPPPGDDDDLDVLGGVEVGQQRQDARYRRRTLHGGVADLEAHRRPAGGGHGHHVALRGTGPARDQADRLRQERQWLLESRIEQSLGGEQLPQPSMRASSSPIPTGRMSETRNDSVARPV